MAITTNHLLKIKLSQPFVQTFMQAHSPAPQARAGNPSIHLL
jgi:hypothetical protein